MKNYLLRTLGLGKINTDNTPSTPTKGSPLNSGGDFTPTSDHHTQHIDRKDEEEYKRYDEIWAQPFTFLADITFESEELTKAWNNYVSASITNHDSLDQVDIYTCEFCFSNDFTYLS